MAETPGQSDTQAAIERWQRVKTLVADAMELPPGQRSAYLDRSCGDDAAIREEVESLLAREVEASRLLTAPDSGRMASLLREHHADAAIGRRFGRYEVKAVLGYGGMGVVYRAEQDDPRREVALKVMSGGVHASPYQRRLFRREVQSLARLQHSGIAALYEAGTDDDGRQYFAMELVEGRPLTEHVREERVGRPEMIRTFVKVCEAIHYAHQRGVLHRDIKPSNIIVRDDGQPKVLDFGLAKLIGDAEGASHVTSIGTVHGTLSYMSPEQARGDAANVDTRSDVYALGVMLFELLAGEFPYRLEGVSLPEAVRLICEQEPRRPSALVPSLRGDLDTILLKALAKDPELRYGDASSLGQDLTRFLGDQPILARPPSVSYQFRKFVVRNKGLSAGLAGAVACLVLGLVGTTWSTIQAQSARADAEYEAHKATQTLDLFVDLLAAARPEFAQGNEVSVQTVLANAERQLKQTPDLDPVLEASLRHTLGSTYAALGIWDRAEQQLRAALAIREELLGTQDLETLATKDSLARVLIDLDRCSEAEALADATARSLGRLTGEMSRETLMARNTHALSLVKLWRLKEAQSIVLPAVESAKQAFGADDPETLRTVEIALRAGMIGKSPAQIEALWRELAVARQRVLGDGHPDTLRAEREIAELVKGQGRVGEAEALFGDALNAHRRVLGEQHPATVDVERELVLAGSDGAETADANVRRLQEILAVQRDSLGLDHGDTLDTMWRLGRVLNHNGRYEESEVVLREALDHRQRVFGGTHPATLETAKALAMCLTHLGESEEAVQIARGVLDRVKESSGDDQMPVVQHMHFLALILHKVGRVADAAALLEEIFAVLEQEPGVGRLNWLAGAGGAWLTGCKDPEGAERIFHKIIEFARETHGDDAPIMFQGRIGLAKVACARGELEDAVSRFGELIEVSAARGDVIEERRARMSYGACLCDHGVFEEAEVQLHAAYDLLIQRLPKRGPEIGELTAHILGLYDAWGRSDERERWRGILGTLPHTREGEYHVGR